MEGIASKLDSIRAASKGASPGPVTILGGGIAGLAAALELERLGHDVTIYEARDVLQGRIRTHRFEDDTYGELGPMRIPTHHDATRHYVAACGLELRPFITAHQNPNAFYDIAGVRPRISDAQSVVYPAFDLSPNQRADQLPPKMLGRAIADVVEGLTEDELASIRTPYLSSDRLRDLDRQTMREFVTERCGPSAAELIGVATGLESLYGQSVMMLLRDALMSSGDGFSEIVGGMDLLPEAMVAKLERTSIQVNTFVRSIRRTASGHVELVVAHDGEERVELAERVLCTLPFSALRRIDIDGGFGRSKLRAIRNLSYMSSSKVLLHTRSRFWESKDGVVGGASQSDRLWRACYYPSDNAVAESDATASEHRYNTMYGAYDDGRYVPRDPAVSEGPGVLLASYTWGQDARRIGSLVHGDRVCVVTRELAHLHPELAEPGMVDDAASMVWDTDPWAVGAFSEPGPGEHSDLYADVVAPDGVVHFAGEHASTDPGWMQGAIMSALRAVEEIVTARHLDPEAAPAVAAPEVPVPPMSATPLEVGV